MRIWKFVKESKTEERKYYSAALDALQRCNTQAYDAKQLSVRIQQCPKIEVKGTIKEILELMETINSRLEYGWQDWDE
jgi:hypothetical protein